MNITKILLFFSTLAATTIMATGFDTNTIDLKIGQQSFSETSSPSYSIGYVGSMTFDNNIYFGAGLDLQYSNFDSIGSNNGNFVSASTFIDALIGYETSIGFTPYLIGGVVYANIDGVTYQEFGYGAGVRYSFNDNWSLGSEYKKYDTGFDNTIVNGFLSYSWDR